MLYQLSYLARGDQCSRARKGRPDRCYRVANALLVEAYSDEAHAGTGFRRTLRYSDAGEIRTASPACAPVSADASPLLIAIEYAP